MLYGEFQNLICEFKRISRKNWIPSVNKGSGSVGLTFENELNKTADSLFFPDYNGIEIKSTTRFSKFPFSLFSISFDGPTFPEINRLVDLYGYFDYKFNNKKILRVDLNTIEKTKTDNFSFKLFLDKDNNKLFLEVYDLSDKLIERKSFVYIDTIINRLDLKLRNLAIVHESHKIINDIEYFRYYSLEAYKLRDTNLFLKLLEEGKIFVTLESRIGKSGNNLGKYKNKNLVFKIKREYVNDLFYNICSINTDYGINRMTNSNNSNFYIME